MSAETNEKSGTSVKITRWSLIAVVLAMGAAVRRVSVPRPTWAWRLPAYTIGALAAFWTIERVAGFWS